MNVMIYRAIEFAAIAHADQKRKYSLDPYIVHPIEVARILEASVEASDEMVAAAIMHDVIEDTKYTYLDIQTRFGGAVADLVLGLTDVSRSTDGNREARKKLDAEHIWDGGYEVQTIKCCDMISNSISIRVYDPDFWNVYRHEKKYLLSGMDKADKELMVIAYDLIL